MFTQGFRPNQSEEAIAKSMFYVDNSLKDGVYTGMTKSHNLSIGKDDNPYLILKVEVDNNGCKQSALYRTKFNFYNHHLVMLMKTFDIPMGPNQYPNLDLLCNVPVEVQIKMSGEYANVTAIKVLWDELNSDEALDDNVNHQQGEYVHLDEL